MSERFKPTDIALARRLRALEDAHDATIQASAKLISTMLDGRLARSLPAHKGHETLARVGTIMTNAITLRGMSVNAHHEVTALGADIGLPVTAFGDACQEGAAETFFTGMTLVEHAA